MAEFMELRMKPGTWQAHGIPEKGCWIRRSRLEEMLAGGGEYDADELIYSLMDWLDVTDDPLPALATLSRLLDRHYPPDGRTHATCHFADETGGDRRFLIGAVDKASALVTWQRDNLIFALGQASSAERGRIVIAAPRPLPLNAAQRILGLGMQNFMMEPFDSFQGAITLSGATGNFYAAENGEVTTCYWPHGLGIREQNGQAVDCLHELHPLPSAGWLAPNQIAMLVGIAAGYAKW
ncbi:hypothetical protein G7A66_08920 [Altererythrobacter sp. SALINAS58]|uniref:hypothetical protein n=1 Tax=Alteripontixanthobacter muriae TaxID=2705546 RepID=UPI0015776212|nr:hypothetical protein [Alteripontixanthobacter muriae]NTZ43209.1 hypothetical protein [Alteripontixanthobacter muriae]